MQQRDQSLDALRGFAILAMVFSSSIAFGILPAWMYHAQEPPPAHQFIPTLPGISWVDLVFPFFLFSMGAAIPLALNKKVQEGAAFWQVFYIAGRRLLLLVFFALFTLHMRANIISRTPGVIDHLLSVAAFVLLFFQFYQPLDARLKNVFRGIRALAFALACLLLYSLPFKGQQGFSWYNSDIIILVLGNMAFFGTLIWWLTKKHPWLRMALLPFIMAVFLGSWETGSWNAFLYNATPLPWMYKFYYLKYLFIILPGTLAGEWMLTSSAVPQNEDLPAGLRSEKMVGLLSFMVIISNVVLLFSRHMVANLLLTALICGGIACLLKGLVFKRSGVGQDKRILRFFAAGTYLLLLGLFFEAYEGGIKKDPSTYSYYFVTGGLAFFMLIGLKSLQSTRAGAAVVNYLSVNGRNPMVAYVTGNLLLLPLLSLTGGISLLQNMEHNPWPGVLRGLLFSAVVSLITVFFTRRGWLWKT